MMFASSEDRKRSSKEEIAGEHRCRTPEADGAKDSPINQTGSLAPPWVAVGVVVDALVGVV
jgi:hypothetical protein